MRLTQWRVRAVIGITTIAALMAVFLLLKPSAEPRSPEEFVASNLPTGDDPSLDLESLGRAAVLRQLKEAASHAGASGPTIALTTPGLDQHGEPSPSGSVKRSSPLRSEIGEQSDATGSLDGRYSSLTSGAIGSRARSRARAVAGGGAGGSGGGAASGAPRSQAAAEQQLADASVDESSERSSDDDSESTAQLQGDPLARLSGSGAGSAAAATNAGKGSPTAANSTGTNQNAGTASQNSAVTSQSGAVASESGGGSGGSHPGAGPAKDVNAPRAASSLDEGIDVTGAAVPTLSAFDSVPGLTANGAPFIDGSLPPFIGDDRPDQKKGYVRRFGEDLATEAEDPNQPPVVAEPATLLLLGTGMAFVARSLKKKGRTGRAI